MEENKKREELLEKRDNLLIEIALFGLLIEENTFYSMRSLETEIQNLEQTLKNLQEEQSLKTSKKADL